MRLVIAASLGIVGSSIFYQNSLEWEWCLNVLILQGIIKYGIWITPLIYIAHQVVRVIRINKDEEVVEGKKLDKDEKEGSNSTLSGLIKVLGMLKPYLQNSKVMQLSLLACLATMAITRFTNMYTVLLEKNIVNALTEENFFCWELLLTKFSLGYVKQFWKSSQGTFIKSFPKI